MGDLAKSDSATIMAAELKHAKKNLLSGANEHARRHRKLIDHLTSCGMENFLSIPKIAVVGSQSAGKSSILEALSGITFPRASSTCTRCPTEVRLFSSDQEWECTVKLRFEKDAKGNRLEKVRDVPFGESIRDPAQVEQRLVRAQKAILNPSQPSDSFLAEIGEDADLSKGASEKGEVQFSENVICINIKGKDVRDLAVVDLPGLIANVAEDEDQGNIELVRDLAKKAIDKPDCVILSCITMNEDLQTQPSVMMVKEADPDGERTLGVLTKPDRIEDGTFSNWRPVLEGKEQRLKHGYYVVKNPDPKQLLKGQWASLGNKVTSRLGSDRLADRLSVLLEQIIKNRVPDLIQEARALHTKARQELDSLPAEVTRGQARFLHSMVKKFGEDFQDAVLNNRDDKGLAAEIYDLSVQLWENVVDDRPRLFPVTQSEVTKLSERKDSIRGVKQLEASLHYLYDTDRQDLLSRDVKRSHSVVSKSVAKESNENPGKQVDKFVDLVAKTTGDSLPSGSRKRKAPLYLTLTALKKIKTRATQDMLPKNCPWSVKKELIDMFIVNWESIAMKALTDIEARIVAASDQMVEEHFKRFRLGNLEASVRRAMGNIVSARANETKAFIAGLVKLESRYTTINSETYLSQQQRVLQQLKDAREGCRVRKEIINPQGLPAEAFKPALTDNVEEEMELAAELRAYWQLAFRRFTDNVRSALYTMFVQAVAQDCLDTLPTELGLFEDDAASKAKRYLQEDPNIVQIRAELVANEATLATGLEAINAFSAGAL